MSRLFYAAASPSGNDFDDPELVYEAGAALEAADEESPLHACSVAGEVLGLNDVAWPLRLFAVEGVPYEECDLAHHFHFERLHVLDELPAHAVFGPHGEEVAGLIERVGQLTSDELGRFTAADDIVDSRTLCERLATMTIIAHEAYLSAAHTQARRLATDMARFAGQMSGEPSLHAQLAAADCAGALVLHKQLPRPLLRYCANAWLKHSDRTGPDAYDRTLARLQSVLVDQ